MSIFGIQESSSFARALAASKGVRVHQKEGNVTPVSTEDGSIVIGVPSIYNEKEYMSSLHREISKQSENMKFFHQVEGQGELQQASKGIIQALRTEYHMHGEYSGRDTILSNAYAENCRSNGGISAVVEKIADSNVTLGALVALGNEIRNDWQGYQHGSYSQEVEDEMERLDFLRDEWLQVDDKESLETLLHRVQYEEPPEEQNDRDNQGDDEQGSDGDSGEGESSTGEGPDGEEQEDGGSDGGQSDAGEPNEGDSEEGTGEGKSADGGEEQGEQSSDRDGTTEGQDSQADRPDGEDVEGDKGEPDNSVGATEASVSLKDMGFQKDPVKNASDAEQDYSTPYELQENDLSEVDITDESKSSDIGDKYSTYGQITNYLGTFSLSRKIKKYLIAQSQTGYMYGMKRGKICSKNVYRVKTGGAQPPIFKQKLATKIQTDTAIFLLGDCSGSMRGDRYVTSASCQIAMSEVLQTLDIVHMMMQFSTGGRGRKHYTMKKFSERRVSRDTLLDRYSSHRIRMGCNADGEAVTAAAQLLAQRPEANRLLIVLSDGSPAYGSNDRKYLKDTVKSIEDSKTMDIIGVGIQTSSVRKYYNTSEVVNELGELERVLLGLLKTNIMR